MGVPDDGFETVWGGLLGPFERVAVDVERGAYRGMAEPVSNHLRVFALSDEHGGMGVAQIVRPAKRSIRQLRAARDRISRALTAAVRPGAGTVYRPKEAPWLGELEQQLLTFPSGRHDDRASNIADSAIQTSRHTAINQETLARARDESALSARPAHLTPRHHRRWLLLMV